MPALEELHLETNEMVNIESNSDLKEMVPMLPKEGCVGEETPSSDPCLDVSQISGPDGRPGPTPLSQIGFRDPASLGAGEQLTLLSIEVTVILMYCVYWSKFLKMQQKSRIKLIGSLLYFWK